MADVPDNDVCNRMYLSYKYAKMKRFGPWEILHCDTDAWPRGPCLTEETQIILKRMYLNREIIPSSTCITVQKFDKARSLHLPFNCETTTTLVNDVDILQWKGIDFSAIFTNFRLLNDESPNWFSDIEGYTLCFMFFPVSLYCIVNMYLWFNMKKCWYLIIINMIYSSFFFVFKIYMKRLSLYCRLICLCHIYINYKLITLYILEFVGITFFIGPVSYGYLSMFTVMFPSNGTDPGSLNELIGNSDSCEMERDISYFILNELNESNSELILNLSCRILNICMIDNIMKDLQKKHPQNTENILKFTQLHKKYSNCLFDYDLCDEMVGKKVNYNQIMEEKVSKYIKCFFILPLLFSLTYVTICVLFIFAQVISANVWRIVQVFCRILVWFLMAGYWLYVFNLCYAISHKFIQSSVYWLDPVSFQYFCREEMYKQDGITLLFDSILKYCYLIDIYMNNYLIHQTLHTLHKLNNNNNFVYTLPNDILDILISYLWSTNEKKRYQISHHSQYDAIKLKSMVSDKQSELSLRLNELMMIAYDCKEQDDGFSYLDGTGAKYNKQKSV